MYSELASFLNRILGLIVRVRKLRVEHWRQFGSVDIDLSRRMTILTGANGAGKTTILNLLSRHFGWSINLIADQRRSAILITDNGRKLFELVAPKSVERYDDITEKFGYGKLELLYDLLDELVEKIDEKE